MNENFRRATRSWRALQRPVHAKGQWPPPIAGSKGFATQFCVAVFALGIGMVQTGPSSPTTNYLRKYPQAAR
jgi:hypothetical protein